MKYTLIILSSLLLLACNSQEGTQSEEKAKKSKQSEVSKATSDKTNFRGDIKLQDSLMNPLNKKIREDLDNAQLYVNRAKLYQKFNDFGSAKEDLQRAYGIDSTNLAVLLAYGDHFMQRGKLSQSLDFLSKARALYPEESVVYLKLGELFIIGKDNQKSLQNADLAIKYDKFNAQAYYLKGFNFLEMGDTSKAISSFQTTVEQNPEHLESYLQLGMLYSEKSDPLAIAYFDNALEIKPKHKEALYGKAMFQQEHEMYNEAMATYHEALKYYPDFREAHYNLGYVHMYYLKLYRQATLHFTDAIEVDPNYFQAYYNRGYSFELLGDINNAAKDYRKALSINPNYDLAANGLSRVTEGI
ncbi:MAG: tetratricopeptide repeat protein [Vicingaceae bacterium]